MGVHGLWDLLAPVGRRVSVETLAGKKLAIDASIWMVQFMKAMRDEKGEMVRNAHILGFFRRICKLLFLRTKPVFVFDGATPALKRRTVIARRRQRENAQAKIRKTAEKLLLNHLKAMRLKELANDLEKQRQQNDAKGKKVIEDQVEELANDLEKQRQQNDAKGKKVIEDEVELAGNNAEGNGTMPFSSNQEALDEMLAASLAAEDDDIFTGNASTSGVEIPFEEEEDDDDEDEEMVLPAINGKVDPAVLAALPPSMQLDLLVQMRERLMAENRQKYQKVKKVPAKFSELQIEAYLKTVAFRREIDEVRKSTAGKGVGGVQTSRIASEANREFIFSSSFTGDKQILTSGGVESHGEKQDQTPLEPSPSRPAESIASTKKNNTETGAVTDDTGRVFDDDIETYLDERGHVRVSRVRAMGIRMTRDLQRNLDLMKEIEQDSVYRNEITNSEFVLDKNAGGISGNLPDKIQLKKASYQGSDGSVHLDDRNDRSTSKKSNSMEISFEDDVGTKDVDDDDLFARLVAGDSVLNSKDNISPSTKHSCDSDSDIDWEEGVIVDAGDSSLLDVGKETRRSLAEGCSNDESDVEWEDGDSTVLNYASTSLADPSNNSSKGALEEDADFREAIRRSLEDTREQKFSEASFKDEKLKETRRMAQEITGIQENGKPVPNLPRDSDKQTYELVSAVGGLDGEAGINVLSTDDSPVEHLATSMVVNTDSMEGPQDKPFERYPKYHAELFQQDAIKDGCLLGEIGDRKSLPPVGDKLVHLAVEELKSNAGSQMSTSTTNFGVSSDISGMVLDETPHVIAADAEVNVFEAAAHNLVVGTPQHGESSVKGFPINHNIVQKLSKENLPDAHAEQEGDEEFTIKAYEIKPMEVTEASLEEERTNLSRERIDLEDEQRKLERNAESVTSEMFTECQELLQMFGLPYIIAPMEAEAQCAYMELSNLVDGVVTDDSDVFLFGAQSVYKNIFDDRKYVETYFMKDIENELGLTREQLIRMALLLGSDYTEGVSGIGIVNAIEVMNAFPEEDGLTKFREWIESPDPAILGKFDVQTGSSSRNRGSKVGENNVSCSNSNMDGLSAPDQTVSPAMDDIQNTKQIFMDKHRNVSKNWHIPSSFPNEAVVSAYVSPQVDKSTDPFSWGKPDLFVLRKLCWEKFGWNMQKADELLLPVLKEYSKHEKWPGATLGSERTQLRLEAFYTFNERFAKIRSKRINKAVKGITGKTSVKRSRDDKSEKSVPGAEDCIMIDEGNSIHKSTAKLSKKRKNKEPEPSEAGNINPMIQTKSRQNTRQKLSARGRGRGRGNERHQANGRVRRKQSSGLEDDENSSDDGCSSDYKKEEQDEKLGRLHGLRKSTRTRKAVKYTADDDLEIDEPGKASQDKENCSDGEIVKEPFEGHDLVGDATASTGEKNQHKEEHSSGDYFEMGGGFCSIEEEPEVETDEPSVGQNGDPSFEVESSKEYLNMGGGFCLDEDETKEDCASEPAKESVSNNFDHPHCSSLVEEANTGTSKADAVYNEQNLDHLTPGESNASISLLATSSPERIRKDGSGTPPLSAMPYLRRKRRKS